QVVEPGQPAFLAIVQRFPQALQADGTLDRRWLRTNVLPDDDARKWLESVTHPAIRGAIQARLSAQRHLAPYQLLDSPLLLETGQDQLCDVVVVVDATEDQQIARTVARDGNDETLVRQIMTKQWSRARRLQGAHYIVDNTGSRAETTTAVQHLHQTLLERAHYHGRSGS
ncbi:MAG: dephospho-CoA kinase, partial [Natronospirillum sp.]